MTDSNNKLPQNGSLQKIRVFYVNLSVSRDEFQKLYTGHASSVRAQATNGQVINFPARNLMPFLLHNGVHGRFKLCVDHNNKLVSLEKN